MQSEQKYVKSDRAKYQRAWAERRLAFRLRWGAFLAVVPLWLLAKPLGWYFETAFFSNFAITACGLAGIYGHLLAGRFICPNCGEGFDGPAWWLLPDRCRACGVVAGTLPPHQPTQSSPYRGLRAGQRR